VLPDAMQNQSWAWLVEGILQQIMQVSLSLGCVGWFACRGVFYLPCTSPRAIPGAYRSPLCTRLVVSFVLQSMAWHQQGQKGNSSASAGCFNHSSGLRGQQ
jgi:hypothetical protein